VKAVQFPLHFLHTAKHRQSTSHTCGVAAAMVLLNYWTGDADSREDHVAEEMKTDSENGTDPTDIAAFLENRGLKVETKSQCTFADLEGSIDAGRPALLCLQAWQEPYSWETDYAQAWDDGHYVIIVGYDPENFYFMDPSTFGFFTYIPRNKLMTRWHDISGKGVKYEQWMLSCSRVEGAGFNPFHFMPLH